MDNRDAIKVTLKILGLSGLSGLAVAAPNAVHGLDLILKRNKQKGLPAGKIMRQLKQQGLVHLIKEEAGWHYSLTPAGSYRLQQIIIDELEIPRPAKWDGRWRLVIFDVPVKQSAQRTRFVNQLQRLGFVMLQKSTWVHPFPCFEQVEQLAGHYNVLRYCGFLEVSWLDNLTARRLYRTFSSMLD